MDTNQVTAWATVVLAAVGAGALIANAVVAVFTLKAARATQRSAAATEKAAESTRDEAEATREEAAASLQVVKEMRADRELTFRPYLSWELSRGLGLHATNNGRGPALNAVFCALGDDKRSWYGHLPTLLDFGQGDKIPDEGYWLPLQPMETRPPPTPGLSHPVRKVAMCEDQLGNRYRFSQGSVEPEIWQRGQPKPDWVMWYEEVAPITPAR
jgi:hypothetical protein